MLQSIEEWGMEKGERLGKLKTALKLLNLGTYTIEQVAEITEMNVVEISEFKKKNVASARIQFNESIREERKSL